MTNIFTGDGVGSGTGLGNGVNSETVAVTIADNVFDGLYASNIATFPVGVAAVDMNTYILANTFVNAVARPISFFPIDGTASVVGTSYNESFRLDEGSLTTGISADAGGGNDALYGSMYGDTLTGGTGNDRIEGNGGADTAVFAGTYAGHSISYAAGVVTVTDTNIADGDTGTDTIIGVERLSFSDRGVLIVDAAALSGSGTYTTIQSAIDAAQAGDTIIVRAGTYTEDLSVTKSVTILGAFAGTEGQSATRTASSAMGETNIIGHATVSSAALVTIDGLRFEETALVASYGLVHISSGNATVTNSVFYSDVKGAGSEVRAVYASPGSGGTATISHNYITGAFPGYGYSGNGSFQRGVWYDGSDGSALVVDHNKIEYTRSGVNVDMSGASTAVVSSNEFHVVATGTAVGVDTDGFSLVGNSYLDTGEELNLRNITTPITYDATDDVVSIAVSSGTAYYNILGGTANDTITGTAFNDVLEGNQLVHGGDAARYAPGTDTDADTFYGMAGNDMLFGEGGNDYLDGGTGADVMVGGQGNDTYVVDDAGDQTIEGDTSTVNFGVDTVLTTLGVYTLEANVENLTNIGNQTLTATGNALANVMTGGSGRDVFAGGDGNDTLIGGDGNDALFGNGGDDTMIGGAGNDIYVLLGNDTIVELANGGTDEVRANKSLNLNDYANIENGTLLSPGGAASVLTLTGTAGNNTLIGNSGDNIIIGGAGRDLITGGGGADTFRYTTALPNQSGIGAQADRITDFIDYVSDNQKYDLIDVFAIDAKANSAGNNAFSFIGSAAFTAEGQIRVIDNGTDTIIEFNTSGTTGAEMQIVLSGHHMISDVNFLL